MKNGDKTKGSKQSQIYTQIQDEHKENLVASWLPIAGVEGLAEICQNILTFLEFWF